MWELTRWGGLETSNDTLFIPEREPKFTSSFHILDMSSQNWFYLPTNTP